MAAKQLHVYYFTFLSKTILVTKIVLGKDSENN